MIERMSQFYSNALLKRVASNLQVTAHSSVKSLEGGDLFQMRAPIPWYQVDIDDVCIQPYRLKK
jgi:Neuraminidase (sialidase)